MNSRDFILQKIRNAMVPVPVESVGELPPLQESENPSVETMGKTFSEALEALTGKCIRVASLAEAWAAFEKLAKLINSEADDGDKNKGDDEMDEYLDKYKNF